MDRDFERSPSAKSRLQTAIWTVKVAFLFIGVVSTGFLFKLAIPYSVKSLLSWLPRLWISFRTWLSPPYLYILVNFIIIGIAASSTFHQNPSDHDSDESNDQSSSSSSSCVDDDQVVEIKRIDGTDSSKKTLLGLCTVKNVNIVGKDSKSDGLVSNRTVSARSGGSSGSGGSRKASPEKMASKEKESKSEDSMEETWEAITGGTKPPARQLKKSETWNAPPVVRVAPELKKSDTFSDTASSTSSGSGGLRRRGEFVLSQDELNRRVEAFIKTFNNNIRLERQESLKQQMELANRAVY
ncbi:hypothetical protein Scep_015929 [Stephania cephalantha]|uniref:DUF4408 domain-containing protein n=1 Tax=Stephania cephalantha TaxID=152367 RepID=A0AAP0NVB4_9MAGN